MPDDDEDAASMRDRLACEQGHDSYADAPRVVQNVIDSIVKGAWIDDPFASFNRQYGDVEDDGEGEDESRYW